MHLLFGSIEQLEGANFEAIERKTSPRYLIVNCMRIDDHALTLLRRILDLSKGRVKQVSTIGCVGRVREFIESSIRAAVFKIEIVNVLTHQRTRFPCEEILPAFDTLVTNKSLRVLALTFGGELADTVQQTVWDNFCLALQENEHLEDISIGSLNLDPQQIIQFSHALFGERAIPCRVTKLVLSGVGGFTGGISDVSSLTSLLSTNKNLTELYLHRAKFGEDEMGHLIELCCNAPMEILNSEKSIFDRSSILKFASNCRRMSYLKDLRMVGLRATVDTHHIHSVFLDALTDSDVHGMGQSHLQRLSIPYSYAPDDTEKEHTEKSIDFYLRLNKKGFRHKLNAIGVQEWLEAVSECAQVPDISYAYYTLRHHPARWSNSNYC